MGMHKVLSAKQIWQPGDFYLNAKFHYFGDQVSQFVCFFCFLLFGHPAQFPARFSQLFDSVLPFQFIFLICFFMPI